jgi:hypothetical protein
VVQGSCADQLTLPLFGGSSSWPSVAVNPGRRTAARPARKQMASRTRRMWQWTCAPWAAISRAQPRWSTEHPAPWRPSWELVGGFWSRFLAFGAVRL